jgi:hypothetical protein
METVWISHPHLDDRKVQVPASSLPHHQRAGWEETDPPPPPPLPVRKDAEETTEAPATAGASALPDESPRGRRTTTKGDK